MRQSHTPPWYVARVRIDWLSVPFLHDFACVLPAFVALFTLPMTYQHFKRQIDTRVLPQAKQQLTKAAQTCEWLQAQTTLVNGLAVVVFGGILWFVLFPVSTWVSCESAFRS
jgi:hypothetical protein